MSSFLYIHLPINTIHSFTKVKEDSPLRRNPLQLYVAIQYCLPRQFNILSQNIHFVKQLVNRYYLFSQISTRRLSARPWSVSLVDTGLFSPL